VFSDTPWTSVEYSNRQSAHTKRLGIAAASCCKTKSDITWVGISSPFMSSSLGMGATKQPAEPQLMLWEEASLLGPGVLAGREVLR